NKGFGSVFQKQTVLHSSHHMIEVMCDLLWIIHRPKRAVDYVMPAIGDEWFLVNAETQSRLALEPRQLLLGRLPTVRNNLHRNGYQRAQPLHNFRFIRNDDHPFAGSR